MTIIFHCSKCSAAHPATLSIRAIKSDEETIQKLKEVWDKASDRLFVPVMERFDKLSIPFEAMEQYRPKEYKAIQLAKIKACAAYLAAKQDWSYYYVPDTLISVPSGKTMRILQCADGCSSSKDRLMSKH